MAHRRLVRVLLVDPSEHVPLDHAVLYDSKEKMTDSTDQELFFEIGNITDILAAHNEKRTGFIDRTVKERTEHLPPLKIRDLQMRVVTIAQF